MQRTILKSKIHRATVTGSDLNYEGSIAIDAKICSEADLTEFEKVDIYDVNNGSRFSTYIIQGTKGEFSLNGAAARLVHTGDKIIIASYANYDEREIAAHRPKVVIMNEDNSIKEIITK